MQLVWLRLLEESPRRLTRRDFARGWLDHIHYMWDEYGRCRWNLRRGVPPEAAGVFENWFNAGMGSPIRSEIWACLFPGDAASAAYYGALDASLDHGIEGIYGEAFCAAVQALVCGRCSRGGSHRHRVALSARRHRDRAGDRPGRRALRRGPFALGEPRSAARRHDHENFTHAPLNVALVVLALLHGAGDFDASILLSTNAGYDTDSTAATVGATLGLALGGEAIPERWKKPIGEGVYLGPGILHLDGAPKTLPELARRVHAQVGQLESKRWEDLDWSGRVPPVDLGALPGTIGVDPRDGSAAVPWANGEFARRGETRRRRGMDLGRGVRRPVRNHLLGPRGREAFPR
ncbi:MAG: ADP-ribosylglycohydrolase family protein [Verrucomicrobiota bacterium]